MSAVDTPPTVPPSERQCPRCGAALSDRQEWCLRCGAAVGTRVVAAPGWRAPIAIVGTLLAVAVIAIAIALVELADDTERVAQAPAAATPAPTVIAGPTATPTPTTEAEPTTTAEPTSTPAAGDRHWPAGRTGWTVILASKTSRSEAEDELAKFEQDGITGLGILRSDNFSSLRSGYWVVFTGRYDSQSEAATALEGIDAKDAYVRRVVPG